MVPVIKVRNMNNNVNRTENYRPENNRNESEDNERRQKIQRSKSVHDLSGMIKTTNWMETERKVYPGFSSITRSKSSSNLNRKEPHPINDADPRDVLNHIKKWQPNFAQHESSHNQFGHYSKQQLFGHPYNEAPLNIHGAHGLPLQYPTQSKMSHTESTGFGEMNDALRNSFARWVINHESLIITLIIRIMNVRPTTPTNVQYSTAPLSTPISYVKARSEIYFDGKDHFNDSKSVISSKSAPEL